MALSANIFDIQRFSTGDGPGIRTTFFFKGCPLRCLWCQNPEAMSPGTQRVLRGEDCVSCGRVMGVGAVMKVVLRDSVFYKHSGGGVTLSGGEPVMQGEAAVGILRECRRKGIHTAVETSGCAPWKVLLRVLQHCDLVFCDIKHMDADEHERLTGRSNELILENIRRMSARKCGLILRVPVIPGKNDSAKNLRRTAEFIKSLPHVSGVELLPYNPLAEAKYLQAGMRFPLGSLRAPSRKRMHAMGDFFRRRGIAAIERGGLYE